MSLPISFRDDEWTALFIWLSIHIPLAATLSRSWAVLFILPAVETALLAATFHFTRTPTEAPTADADSGDTTETVRPIASIPPTSLDDESDSPGIQETQRVGFLADMAPGTRPTPAGSVDPDDDTPDASEVSGGLADSDSTLHKDPDSYAFEADSSLDDATPASVTRDQFPAAERVPTGVDDGGDDPNSERVDTDREAVSPETDTDSSSLSEKEPTPKATPGELRELADAASHEAREEPTSRDDHEESS